MIVIDLFVWFVGVVWVGWVGWLDVWVVFVFYVCCLAFMVLDITLCFGLVWWVGFGFGVGLIGLFVCFVVFLIVGLVIRLGLREVVGLLMVLLFPLVTIVIATMLFVCWFDCLGVGFGC